MTKQTTTALLNRYVDEHRQFYKNIKMPFGAKHEDTYAQSFWIDYKNPKCSYERSRMAWNFWDRKIKLKGEN